MSRPNSRLLLLLLWLGALGLDGVRADSIPTGTLGANETIRSEILGYKLQYRVYLPPGHDPDVAVPTLYVTDGQWYIERGELPVLLDRLIGQAAIDPVAAVFVDNRDPDNLKDNRRNQQFFCNERYAAFFENELIPRIDRRYGTSTERIDRTILGLSFGGLNSACFALQAHESFGGVAMQSPAMHPVPDLHRRFERRERLPLRIFLSTGTRRDNEESARRLHRILKGKCYDLRYVEVDEGHDWRNWKPLLDDVLTFFYPASP